MSIRIFVGIVGLSLLAGCDVNPDISAVGNNEYMLTETDMKLGFGAVRPAIVASVNARADMFCSQQGSEVEKIENKFENAKVGSPATYSLIFKCG
jgi:hypothetical protein